MGRFPPSNEILKKIIERIKKYGQLAGGKISEIKQLIEEALGLVGGKDLKIEKYDRLASNIAIVAKILKKLIANMRNFEWENRKELNQQYEKTQKEETDRILQEIKQESKRFVDELEKDYEKLEELAISTKGQLENKLKSLQYQISELEKEVEGYKAEIEEIMARIEQKYPEVAANFDTINDTTKHISAIKDESTKYSVEIAQNILKVGGIDITDQKVFNMIRKYEDAYPNLEYKDPDRYKEYVRSAISDCSADASAEQKQAMKDVLQEQLGKSSFVEHFVKLNEELNNLNKEKIARENELKKLEDKHSDLKEYLNKKAELEEKISHDSEKIKGLKTKIDKITEEVDELKGINEIQKPYKKANVPLDQNDNKSTFNIN